VKILVFGKGHVGHGLLSDRGILGKNDIKVIDKKNINNFDITSRDLSGTELIIFATGISGGVEFNLKNRHELFEKNMELNSKITKISASSNCRIVNFVPACVYPIKDHGIKSKETDLYEGPLEISSLEYAKSQLSRMEMLNSSVDSNLIRHLIVTNIFGDSKSSLENSHFFDHLIKGINSSSYGRLLLRGSGDATRDFLYNKELTQIFNFLEKNWNSMDLVTNFAGYGAIKIRDAVELFLKTLNLQREVVFENPEFIGTDYKVLDDSNSRIMGWRPRYSFANAIRDWRLS
jgi:nucleoside-diphosphate-sugar epimerase